MKKTARAAMVVILSGGLRLVAAAGGTFPVPSVPFPAPQGVPAVAACVMLAGCGSRPAPPESGEAAPQPQARFSVVQWNIGHCARGKASKTAITAEESTARSAEYRAMIARLKPDFLGVSEFDPVFDKAGRLATNEVFAAFPTKVLGPKNNYQCNALFTRFPCVRHEVVDYTLRRQKVYFIDSVFLFGTNEVHFVQSHLDWFKTKDGQRYALPQMRQLVEHFKDAPYVIVSADFNVSEIGHFAAFAEAGYTVANDGRYAVLDNVVVKGFDVKELFAADNERRLSDHRIVGCVLEMKPGM